MGFKFVDELDIKPNDKKEIELSQTVEIKETFSIQEIKSQIKNLDISIQKFQATKASLEKKLFDASQALNITITEDIQIEPI